MTDRRKSLSLAAVLAATVLTGGAAILGMAHAPSQAAQPAAVVQAAVQPAQQQHWEEGD